MDSDLPEVNDIRKRMDGVRQTPARVPRAPVEELYGRGAARVNGNEITVEPSEAPSASAPKGERIVVAAGVETGSDDFVAARVVLRTEEPLVFIA